MATTTVSNLPNDATIHSQDLIYLSHFVSAGVYVSRHGTVQALTDTVAPLTTKGDLLTFTTLNARLGVGTNNQFLRANSATTTGLEWQTITTSDIPEGSNMYFTVARVRATELTGLSVVNAVITSTDTVLSAFGKAQGQLNSLVTGVSSVFGRTGAVIAVSGDYTTDLVTEATNLYFTVARVRATDLTGLSVVNSAITSLDTVLSAFGKTQGQLNALVTGVSSVFGRTGAVIAVSGDYTTDLVTEATNLYFTNARALTAVGKTNNATGWTIAGGTTSKSLVVVEDCTINQNLSTTADVTHSSLELIKDATGTAFQLRIKGASDSTQELRVAYDTTNNVGWLQAAKQGTSFNPFILQPDGSEVGVGYLRNDTLPGELFAVKGSAHTTTYFSQAEVTAASVTTPAAGYKLFANSDDNGNPYVRDKTGALHDLLAGVADSKWDVWGVKLTPKPALAITGLIITDATGFESMETTNLGHTFDFNMSDITGIFRFFQAVQTSTQFRVLNNAALSDVSGISFHGNNELYRMGYDAQGSNVFLRANLGAADADHAFALSFGSDVVNAPVFFKFDGTSTATIFDTTEAESFTINKSLTTTTFTDSSNLLTFASDVSFSTKIVSDVIIENATPSLTIRDSADNNKRMLFEYDVANECGVISAFGTAGANRVLKLTPGFTTTVGLPAANSVSTIASEQPTLVNYADQYLYNLLQTNQSAGASTPATIADFYNTQRYNQIAGTRSDTMWQMGILQETSASDNDRWFIGRPGLSSGDLVVHRTGRVAIGTASSQAEQLHVAGTFRATGAATLLSVNVTGATTLNTLDVTGLTTVTTLIASTAAQFSNYADFSAIATPATPGSNFRVYQKTDKNLYGLNSDGNEFNLSTSNVRIVTASDTNTTADDVILCDSTAGALIFTVDTSLLKKRIVVIHDKGGNGVSWGPGGGQTISSVAAPILFAGIYSAVTIEPGSVSTEGRIVAEYL